MNKSTVIFLKIILVTTTSLTAVNCRQQSQISEALEIFRSNRLTVREGVETLAPGVIRSASGTDPVSVAFFDFDHTLADTVTRIPVIQEDGTKDFRDSKCFQLFEGETADFDALSEKELLNTRPVSENIERLQQSEDAIILTARGESHNFNSIPAWLRSNGSTALTVIPVNSKEAAEALLGRLRLSGEPVKLPKGFKKAVFMAGFLDLYRNNGHLIRTVTYYEDTDYHLRGAMQLLPVIYPDINFIYYDIIRENGTYTTVKIAEIKGERILSDTAPESYDSGDCDLKPEN